MTALIMYEYTKLSDFRKKQAILGETLFFFSYFH